MTAAPLFLAPFALALAAVPASSPATSQASSRGTVAVRAGTLHLVEGGRVVENGTILCRDGRIVAVGADVAVPPGARVVDYGPGAVIVPGLVAADSSYGSARASDRTADPELMAVDGFDPYTTYGWALAGGVTTAYVAPARGRLIAGQGAMVKLGGEPGPERVLERSAALHGAVSAEARSTPGYWEPPVPATVDVGLGVAQPQLPKTVTGAVVALRELLALAKSGGSSEEYGPYAGPGLADVLARELPWRMGAQSEAEVRALLEFAPELKRPLVIDGALGAADLAPRLAEAGVGVIVDSPIRPNRAPRDFGKDPEAVWPRFDVAARMAEAGCRFAIATPDDVNVGDLLFAARSASRGGLDAGAALRAITLTPAELFGVADRVGSLAPSKDADFVVLNGHPLSAGAGVLATWVDGEVAWEQAAERASGSGGGGAVVIEVDALHVGDGEVISPGSILLQGGRIVQVGRDVPVPPGASIVRGAAAMPGMIDALGHLGLEGSNKVPSTDFKLSRIVEPGDFADRRVAKSGVTTVALSPRGTSKKGAPILAYKPAAQSLDAQIVDEPAALRFQWSQRNRAESGEDVREVLKKTLDYAKEWKEYEEALAKWTPPSSASEEDEAKDEDEEKKDEDKAEEKDEGDDDKKSKKSKKKKDVPAKPVTGAWVAFVTVEGQDEPSRMRLYVDDREGEVSGSLRCAAFTDGLIDVEGMRDEREVSLSGTGTRGAIAIEAEVEDPDDEDEPRLLKGKVVVGDVETEFEAEQTSTVYEVAGRRERRREEPVKEKPVKGEPKAPRVDNDLEPMRAALEGKVAVLVGVDRSDEILACVDAFDGTGILPVLVGAEDAHKVADRISGRVAGVLLSHDVVRTEARTGTQRTNRYAELVAAGIPVAFHSAAEEGAAELPMLAAYAVSQGMSPAGAVRALTADAARILAIEDRVGRIAAGMDGDVVLLDGDPFDPRTSVVRVWVAGKEVR